VNTFKNSGTGDSSTNVSVPNTKSKKSKLSGQLSENNKVLSSNKKAKANGTLSCA